MGSQNVEPTTAQDTLSSYFDSTATAVRQMFARFEYGYVFPTVDLLRVMFLSYPIPFVFFSIFSAFSLFPVLAYIIVSMATLSVALTIALCLAFVFSISVSLMMGGVLLATLGFALLLSGFLTTLIISVYLSARLVAILHRSGRSGFRVWLQEVMPMFFPSSAHPVLADDAQDASGSLYGKDMKDSNVKMEPLPNGPLDGQQQHVT